MLSVQEMDLINDFRLLDARKKLIMVSYIRKEARAAAGRRPLLRVVGGSDLLVDGGKIDKIFHEG